MNTIEPGRVHQSLTPDHGITKIERTSNYYQEIVQSEGSSQLSVKAAPNMPVIFYASQNGHFENGLNTINVMSDASGHASAKFSAGTGIISDCRVKAASPASAGSVNFIVHVLLNQQTITKYKEGK